MIDLGPTEIKIISEWARLDALGLYPQSSYFKRYFKMRNTHVGEVKRSLARKGYIHKCGNPAQRGRVFYRLDKRALKFAYLADSNPTSEPQSLADKLNEIVCGLTEKERKCLLIFWQRQMNGKETSGASLAKLCGMGANTNVSQFFGRLRDAGVLRVDRTDRKAFWPKHHYPSELGMQLIALLLSKGD